MANAGQSWATGPLFFLKTGRPKEVSFVSGNWATTNFEPWNNGHSKGNSIKVWFKEVFFYFLYVVVSSVTYSKQFSEYSQLSLI